MPGGDGDGDGDGDGNPHNCENVDLVDLADVSEIDDVGAPGVCCGEITAPEDIGAACMTDCAYAACKLATAKIREAAAIVGTGSGPTMRLNGDLKAVAEYWESPEQLYQCAGSVQAAAGNWATIDFGGGPSDALPGHLKYVEMHILCAPDGYMEVSPTEECQESVNTEPEPTGIRTPTLTPGAVTFHGPFGEGYSEIASLDYTVSNPGCGSPPCPFQLRN